MIEGVFFDGERSAARPARLEFSAPEVVRFSSETRQWEGKLADVEISERIGSIPRRVAIPGVGVFETLDNDGVDRALAALGRPFSLVHWLEARWPIAIAALVAIAAGSFVFVRYGVPMIADFAATTLPSSVDRVIGARSLEILDGRLLHPSKLAPERQAELQTRFSAMTADPDTDTDVETDAESDVDFGERLELRAAPVLGPNALALPSGIVVLTDELVELAHHDDELVAVLAHELGHVRGRHALRRLFQSLSVSALAFALVGDISSASALFAAVPALIDAKHSRDFEREADGFAKAWLSRHGIPPFRFEEILCRMENGGGRRSEQGAEGDEFDFDDEGARGNEQDDETATPEPSKSAPIDRFSRYLSSHPTTDERARCERSAVPSDHRADVWKDMREEVSRSARDAINAPASPRKGQPPGPTAPDS